MKKFIITLISILGISYAANAQQAECVVRNGDGASVVITVQNYSKDGMVDLLISSDSNQYVNLNFTITYLTRKPHDIYSSNRTTKPYNVLWKPLDTDTKIVYINNLEDQKIVSSIESINISGARCE